jgi:hypothetical protein
MASTVVQPLADRIGAVAAGLGLSPTVKEWVWAPADLSTLPAAVVDLPTIARSGLDPQGESELGSYDWFLDFPVTLYFDLSEPIAAQTQAAAYLEAFIEAVDTDATLTGMTLDAKVTRAEPSIRADESRPALAYETHVEIFKLVQ